MTRNKKEYIIEVIENNIVKYFKINRFLGEISYELVNDIKDATLLDKYQINYDWTFLRNKEYKFIKID